MPTLRLCVISYFIAPKRLSNEFAGTIGCEPVTMLSFAAGAAAAAVSESDGFSGGRGAAAACLGSAALGTAAMAFGSAASERVGSLRLASITFGFAGAGALAVVSLDPPNPTLRARLEKKPSDCAVGAADATRVAGA